MGAALIVKPGLDRRFSVITFGMAQIAMDIEPGLRMLTGAEVLHGPTHTFLGALMIAYLVTLTAPSVCARLLRRWNKEVIHHKLPWLVQRESVSKTAVVIGALFGTLSHVVLDSLIHHDIQPLLPFSPANPFADLVTHDAVYQLCAIAGVAGAAAWVCRKWAGRATEFNGARPSPFGESDEQLRVTWVHELRSTWLWTSLLSAGPALVYGTGFLSVGVLTVAVLIGIPSLAISRLIGNPGLRVCAHSGLRRASGQADSRERAPDCTSDRVFSVGNRSLSRLARNTHSQAPGATTKPEIFSDSTPRHLPGNRGESTLGCTLVNG
jgi:membrane-bound metal-dependent hydrolase YbcI (DUF457 family)